MYQILKPGEFNKVGNSNEYWIWHLLPEQIHYHWDILPLSSGPNEITGFHTFKYLIEKLQIPVFESKVQDWTDFVMSLDDVHLQKLKNKSDLGPIVIGFNYNRMVYSTLHLCYCSEGVLEIVGKLNPELLLKLDD